VMRSILSLMSGAKRKAEATLVRGPVGMRVIFSSLERVTSMMTSTAERRLGWRVGGGRTGPSRPLSPCTSGAMMRGRVRGAAAPAATSTWAPTKLSTFSALSKVFSKVWLPATTVTARRSSFGEARAISSAMASSWPGSQSMMTGMRDNRVNSFLGRAMGGPLASQLAPGVDGQGQHRGQVRDHLDELRRHPQGLHVVGQGVGKAKEQGGEQGDRKSTR